MSVASSLASRTIEETLRDFQSNQFALKFAPHDEGAFQLSRQKERLAHFRMAGLAGLLLFNAFLILDLFLPGLEFSDCLLVRLGIVTPLGLLTVFAMRFLPGRWRELGMALSMLPSAIGLLWLYRGSAMLQGTGQSSMVLILMFTAALIRPGPKFFALTLPLWLAGDVLFLSAFPILTGPQSVQAVSLVWTAAGISLLACFWIERNERIGYLLHLRNDSQNAALASINSELMRLSMVDPLTGIANRRSFDTQVHKAWENCAALRQPLAILMMDMDDFKSLNELYGNSYGDSVLCHVSRCLRDYMRENEIVARYGGEEFIALMPRHALDRAVERAQQICQMIRCASLPPSSGNYTIHVTISIGVASAFPAAGGSPVDLLRTADANLYQAKYLGRNREFPASPIQPHSPLYAA